ncbi:unnamed protein product [Ceutorhynchus assimilis]|uniref:Uncharacterized protein n=1 Tax=Ceutorhynchus assimilis TaxID=467358 RepID=A0A9N9QJZ1_9CUCU|nr:unnamed protein product [Ceutorhynchus assimilis]
MFRLGYHLVFIVFYFCCVHGSENFTIEELPVDTLVNLTGNNELWTILLKDCQKPTLNCVQNNIFKYLKTTLDETDDMQFTSFLKFTKNTIDYNKYERSFDIDSNETTENYEDEFPIESMSRSLHDNTAKFFMTHDLELSLPDGLFPNSYLRISPKGLENHGALVNLEIVSKDLEEARGMEEGNRTFKKIRKFINEKLIYALLAILLVVKLLAVKFLFLLPLLVGAATAKKLLLKILLFVFPFLHHIFKFCAYYPIQAKYHHHKHLISHVHQVAPHKYHHGHNEGVEVDPHSYGPPPIEHHGSDVHFSEYDDDISVVPDDGSGFSHGLISHRKDPYENNNEISPYGVQPTRQKPKRPLTSIEIERMIAKAEKEAIIKARLEQERLRIRDENLKLQEQLNQAIKLQEKLKHQTNYLHQKLPPTKISSSVPYSHKPVSYKPPPPLKGSPFEAGSLSMNIGPGIDLPAGYISQHNLPQRSQNPQQVPQYKPSFSPDQQLVQQYQSSQIYSQPINQVQVAQNPGPVYKPQVTQVTNPLANTNLGSTVQVNIQKSVEYDPRIGAFDTSNEVLGNQKSVETPEKTLTISKPKLEEAIYQAATITFDKFYSPILQKIDKILQGLGFNDEPCRERLICSMYKHPTKFSPHSNLISAELSRDSSELQKPTSTNSAVVRFYKYVQAARDGQDQRDCLRLYPGCAINTEVS